MAYDEKTAARVRKALAGRRDVVEKKLMGGLCFMVKGGMCCSVSGKGGLLVRVDIEAPAGSTREQRSHWDFATPPEQLLTETATNYRRWWNNSWSEVAVFCSRSKSCW